MEEPETQRPSALTGAVGSPVGADVGPLPPQAASDARLSKSSDARKVLALDAHGQIRIARSEGIVPGMISEVGWAAYSGSRQRLTCLPVPVPIQPVSVALRPATPGHSLSACG